MLDKTFSWGREPKKLALDPDTSGGTTSPWSTLCENDQRNVALAVNCVTKTTMPCSAKELGWRAATLDGVNGVGDRGWTASF